MAERSESGPCRARSNQAPGAVAQLGRAIHSDISKLRRRSNLTVHTSHTAKRVWGRNLCIAVLILLLGTVVIVPVGIVWALSGTGIDRDGSFPPSLILETKDGELLGTRGLYYGKALSADNLPKLLVSSVLSVEDRRFYKHWGIDIVGILRAATTNLMEGHIVEGGSTITQQLIKMHHVGSRRTFERKAREAMLAVWYELHHDKNEILAEYLNTVYLGAGAYGFPAAAQTYFGKSIDQLTIPELALLVGLIKAPSKYNPFRNIQAARERAAVALNMMVDNNAIDVKSADDARRAPATIRTATKTADTGGWFLDWIANSELTSITARPRESVFVRTTLDPVLQKLAEGTIDDVLSASGPTHNVDEAAMVVMRPDGAVLAMVGGRNYDKSQFNRAVNALRQPGSTFKLFVYLAALRNGYASDDTIDASDIEIDNWQPANYGNLTFGRLSLKTAFAKSVNTATVRLASEVGLDEVIRAARDLGIESPLKSLPSLALGAQEVTLLELTAAYASVRYGKLGIRPWGVVAFGGSRDSLRPLGRPINDRGELRHQKELIEMLRQVVLSGTGRGASIEGFAAGKTGTTQSYRDAWFVGFSDDLIVGVWLGNDDHTPMKNVTGGSLPAQIWKRFVQLANPLTRVAQFQPEEWATKSWSANARAPQCDVVACSQAYRSFRSSDCTYQPYHGPRRLCTKGVRSMTREGAMARTFNANNRCNVEVCAASYRSFDRSSCTYQPYGGGPRRFCEK